MLNACPFCVPAAAGTELAGTFIALFLFGSNAIGFKAKNSIKPVNVRIRLAPIVHYSSLLRLKTTSLVSVWLWPATDKHD
jgi:hypothetical protein